MLYFGRLADAVGAGEAEIEIAGSWIDIEALRALIASRDPRLHQALMQPSVRVAINSELALPGAMVRNSDEVAFLPPVSGG